MNADNRLPFRSAARRVRTRLLLCRWLVCLARTALPALALAAVAWVWLYASGWAGHAALSLALLAVWLLGAAAWAWRRRPSPAAALAEWDRRAGRHEMFLSGLCFEGKATPAPGERLHLNRARPRLSAELPNLARHVPVRVPYQTWLVPVGMAALAVSGLLRPPPPAEDRPMPENARAKAVREVEELAEEADRLARPDEEDTPRSETLEKLKKRLEQSAEQLKAAGDQTPREVLADLEARARQAEQLADQLDAAAEPLSSDMIAELERHADTADLGDALRAGKPEAIAEEADRLGNRLKSDALTLREGARMKNALGQALKVAKPSNRKSVTGRHLRRSHQHLQRNRPKQAGRQFGNLARHFRRAARRRAARQRLQQLANRIRAAGRRLFGKQSGRLQRLAGMPTGGSQARPSLRGMRPLPSNPQGGLGGWRPQSGRPGRPRPGRPRPGAAAPVPGTGVPAPGAGRAPVPGAGQCAGQGAGQAPVPGAGQGAGQGAAGAAGATNCPRPRAPRSKALGKRPRKRYGQRCTHP